MAITATFEADFAQFRAAVDQATVRLKSFQTDSTKVEAALNRVGNAFSGQQIIQQATLATKAIADIGGASTPRSQKPSPNTPRSDSRRLPP